MVIDSSESPPVRRTPREATRHFEDRLAASIKAGGRFEDRVAISIKERGRLQAISDHQAHSARGGGLERVILELRGALRAAEQSQDSEANVDTMRNHCAQHAKQAWLLLTGSVPERIWGRCDCAL